MSGQDDGLAAGRRLLGDETELFQAYHRQLVRTVQHLVNTSPDIVDDACNFAWMEFIRCQPDRDRAWRSWLVTTAQREAWRLHAMEASHVGFELPGDGELLGEPVDPRDVLTLRAELRRALDVLAAVPERRRQVKALQVTGYSYEEVGELLGLTYTRVNRLVTEANESIRRERARLALAQPPAGRSGRLQELEQDPPRWLTAAIGNPPGKLVPAQIQLTWRRAALAIDDYRREYGRTLETSPSARDRRSRSQRVPTSWRSMPSTERGTRAGRRSGARSNAEGANAFLEILRRQR